MRLHSFQHIPFEDPAGIARWAAMQKIPMTHTHWYKGESPPPMDSFDALIIMGGPMNIYEDHLHPWLAEERKFINQAVASGKKAIGVCLGAQFLADALGGRVTQNAQKELGWFPVEFTPEFQKVSWLAPVPQELTVCHWHGDTFSLPQEAILMGSSKACVHQGFVWRKQVLGFQFHIELSAGDLARIPEDFISEFPAGPWVQPVRQIISDAILYECDCQKFLFQTLDKFFDLASNHTPVEGSLRSGKVSTA